MNPFNYEITQVLKNNLDQHSPSVTFEEIWRKGYNRKSRRRILVPVAASVVFCAIASLPVSAAINPILWNGVNIKMVGKDPVEVLKEKLFTPPDARNWMDQSIKLSVKSYPIQQANQSFPFEISRPSASLLPLVQTVALQVPTNSFVVWDNFEQGSNWVVVRQSSGLLQVGKENNSSSAATFTGQQVTIGHDAFAVISDQPNGVKSLRVEFKNKNDQNIELLMEGNVNQDQLLSIAKSYLP